MHRSFYKRAGLIYGLLTVTLVSGCATQAPQPDTDPLLPGQWADSAEARSDEFATADWWAQFDNTELNGLVEQAMQANFGLLASFQRIEQARARLASSRATLFPQLEGGYSASSNSTWDEDDRRISSESDRASLNASYEVDLWGRLRAGAEAAEASLAANHFNHQTVALGLQAQVASTYFQYLAGKDRLRFAEESLANSQQVLRLVKLQFDQGIASRLEWVQQQSSVTAQEAQISSLRNSLRQVAYALDILLGQKPGTLELRGQSLSEIRVPVIATGQPADLLQRRPDVRQAEAALMASHASVEAARAAFFPSLRITASASASQLLISDPVTQAASLAAGLTAPLFDAGRNRSEYDRALAAQEEALMNYYQTLLTAVGEVESSLLDVEQLSENLTLQERRLNLSRESRALAELRYREGSADFITLLDAERSLIDAQDIYMQAELERHLEAVTLYQALGGSWHSTP